MGQVLQAGAGQAPARQAARGGGHPRATCPPTPSTRSAPPGIRAVAIADQMIRAGDHEVVVAGGMESMSNAPYALARARFGYRLGDGELIDLMVHDGLTSTFDGRHMVEQASLVARRARDLARGPGPLGPALAPAGRGGASTPASSPTRSSPVGRRRGRRAPAPRHHAREAGRPAADHGPGGDHRRPATPPASTTARRRWSWRARSSRAAAACRRWRRSWPGRRRRRVRLPRPHARAGRGAGARAGGADDRRRGAGRDQRGLLVGRAQLPPDAGRRRGDRQRQRRRRRAGTPHRRLRGRGSSRRWSTTCAGRAAAWGWRPSARAAARGTPC